MAKRRKKHVTHRRRHRRMSGIGHSSDIMEVLGLVAGSVVATVAQRQFTSMNPKLISGGELVGGHLLKKHSHSPFMTGVGFGLMSAGAIGLTHEFGIIHGVEDFVSGLYDGQMIDGYEQDMQGLGNDNYVLNGLSNEAHVGDMNTSDPFLNEM